MTAALLALLRREDLPDGKPRYVLHPPGHIVVVRLGDDVFALDHACVHAGASLLTGKVVGRAIECRAHGCRFDLSTGALVRGAGDGAGEELRQRTWRVERRGDAWAILDASAR